MFKVYPKFLPEEIVMYLRKSRSDDPTLTVEEVLERQKTELSDWQEWNLDEPIPEENIYEEVVSGESLSARVEFGKLLKRLESTNIKACLVRECSRLGRPDLEEIGRIVNLFRYNKVIIITPRKTFDLSDEWDRKSFQSELMSSREYLDQSKTFLNFGKDRSRREGFYINGVIPYGYEREWVIERKKERPTIKIVEEEAKVVRNIFDWYVNEGIGATKICQRLNALGIPAKKGGLWKKSSVINILKNEHYMGKIVIKKHIKVNTVEDLKITKHCVFNPDYDVIDGRHEAIIDEETFNKANNKIHKYPSVKPSETLQNPFASILKCECGKVMLRKRNRNGYRYLCDEQMYCGNASVSEQDFTDAVITYLKQSLEDISAKVTDNDKGKQKEKHNEYVSLLESRYVEIEKKEISLWDKYAEEKMPKQIFDKLMQKCMEEKQNLETQIELARQDAPKQIDYKGAIATLHETIDALSDSNVSASTKNKLLKSVVESITYRRPKAIRMTPEEAKAKDIKLKGGWYCPEFELEVTLKF